MAPAPDRPPAQFVVFDQNHDQVGNRAFGDRLPEPARPLAALCTCLSPFTPMLFMGEEYGENAPFQFFTDHIDADIAEATREGRRREFAAFASFGEEVPDPQDPATFARSKLTRVADEPLRALYGRALDARRRMSGATEVSLDEDERWLRVRRAGGELVCNFAAQPRRLPRDADARIALASHAETESGSGPGDVLLPPLSGALLA